MKTSFLSSFFETISSPSNHIAALKEINETHAWVAADRLCLSDEDCRNLRAGAFVVLARSALPIAPPFSETSFLPQIVVARVESHKSALEADDSDIRHTSTVVCLALLGMFDACSGSDSFQFSRDLGQILPVSRYHAFIPSVRLLQFIVNGTLGSGFKIEFGDVRMSESVSPGTSPIPMYVHMPDIRGKRTAMFGKTRLGKSNSVKLLMQGMLEMTAGRRDVGQLVFDVNGEYANDNPQDQNRSIASLYSDCVDVYFLARRSVDSQIEFPRKYIRYNFYERTSECGALMTELLDSGVLQNEALRFFLQMEFPDFLNYVSSSTPGNGALRPLRRIQLLWTVLYMAGFSYSEERLVSAGAGKWKKSDLFNPRLSQSLRMAMYQSVTGKPVPRSPSNLKEMAREMEIFSRFCLQYQNDPNLIEGGVSLVEKEEEIVMRFVVPELGVGPRMLASCIPYHSEKATDFLNDILHSLDNGRTVIVDLGSANQTVLQFFSRTLSEAVFRHQESKFVSNRLEGHFVQLYFEEAHMIFPANKPGSVKDIYSRFAKEGAKFNIGIVYSTQSPSTVNSELLSQTENFFIGHISNKREFELLGEVQNTFMDIGDVVLKYRQPGFMHVLTHSHRYVIPVQARVFNAIRAV